MDFITGLPSFQRFTVILVVVDHFSKAAHFGMLPTNFTAVQVADLFAKMICKLHGMPKSIMSDRDPIFLSKFWQELFRFSGTKLRMSTAYHPQSDGQTEIVNKALQQYLRCFVHHKPSTWGQYLHWAEWHYNTSVHSTTGLSPFQVVYGKPPPSLPQYVAGRSQLEAVDTELKGREEILEELKKKLKKAQETMKKFADKRRLAHNFQQGDMVYVKLRPHRQVSVAGHRIRKLSKRYYGPYKVLRQIGEVAFELELPPASRIHPVFHASQLKPCKGSNTACLELPPETMENQPVIQPLAIVGWKKDKDTSKTLVLVQWKGLYPEDTSWEDLTELTKEYPLLNLEDKVNFEGEGDVMDHNIGPIGLADPSEGEELEEDRIHVTPLRAKRNRTRPKYLRDYVDQ